MSRSFAGWPAVAATLEARAHSAPSLRLNSGQRAALRAIAQRIPHNGVLIADEVGMGKTRIAVEVAAAVVQCGGRAAIVVPPGLGYQWRGELKVGFDAPHSDVAIPEFLRSLHGFLAPWREGAGDQPRARGWFRDPIVLLSHAFSNWRLGGSSQGWRYGLLPALYVQARKKVDDRFPRDYRRVDDECGQAVQRAATDICAASCTPRKGTSWRVLETILKDVSWPAALEPAEYGKQANLRQYLENAVGLGLGTFDLVILDEAHKSRGDESRLSSLLANVIQTNPTARYLALTATPVELDAGQWSSSLARVGLAEDLRRELTPIITRYSEAAHKLRIAWRISEEARNEYVAAAEAFERALRPYVLRRDKREDPMVQTFATISGKQPNEYRHEREVAIETSTLARPWKQVVCAAEALSVSTRQVDNSVLKRLRLSIGNGHGIAALMDQARRDPEDQKQLQDDDLVQQSAPASSVAAPPGIKLEARIAWWRRLIDGAVASSSTEEPLYEHPAVLAAVHAIEEETRAGEKVLVFGRFTRPMRALASLLNAREMLRRLDSGEPWPQAKVHGDPHAVRVAHQQLQSELVVDDLDTRLAAQYAEHRRAREQDRDHLLKRLRTGLPSTDAKALALLGALEARATQASADEERHPLALVTRVITELTPELESDAAWGRAFVDLIDGVTDRDEGDEDGDGELDEEEAGVLWQRIEDQLHEEFNGPHGGFARLMNGQTLQSTRRMLQLAFNRPKSLPQVLIAQSLVGREGLNLHPACRTVVLLHPEWNPGVVEQQIGRVDRVGSRWEQLMKTRQDHEPLPRITIRPIVFNGTYDEHNWQVLRSRWDDHRAQLHGVPIPHRQAFDDPESAALIEQLAGAAPNFSPLKA